MIFGTRLSLQRYVESLHHVGSQSLVIRANDNGLTALHTTTTVTIRVIRMSNLPPEIVNTNSTLIYYRGSAYNNNNKNMLNTGITESTTAKQEQNYDTTIARITVKDRTTHDRLFFELLNNDDNMSITNLFSVDPYDGTIRSAGGGGGTLSSSSSSTLQSTLRDTSSSSSSSSQPTSTKPETYSFRNSLIHLDSGLYPLRVRVTNGTLTSEAVMHIKVISITEEMLDSALVIRITNLLPNLFYMENYNTLLQKHLSNLLLDSRLSQFSSVNSPTLVQNSSQDNVYILSVQETDFPNGLSSSTLLSSSLYHEGRYTSHQQRRSKRSLDRAVDILVAVYDPKEREYIKPNKIAQAVNGIADRLAVEFGGEIEAIHDVCTPQVILNFFT
ncbi:unnamed protein product [Trichobilharzia regenti]|nr:unnamed protein product [Trichobilharzia regenti]